jgi:hypothetical protein
VRGFERVMREEALTLVVQLRGAANTAARNQKYFQ